MEKTDKSLHYLYSGCYYIPFGGYPLTDTVQAVGNANTGVRMIYLEALLYFSDIKTVLKQKEIYLGILVKMLFFPFATGWVLSFVLSDEIMRGTLVLLAGLPTMTIIPILAKEGGCEGEYAAGGTMVTLAASLITIPFISFIL